MLGRLRAALRTRPECDWWPTLLVGETPGGEAVVLRPLTLADEAAYNAVRTANASWLQPWDATSPDPAAEVVSFPTMVARYDREARRGRQLAFVVEIDGRLGGQLNLSNIQLGSFRSMAAGYWLSREFAGRGFMPTALAMAADHAFAACGLHRLEVNVRPENASSLAVVRKLGFREEGLRVRMLHIDGEWRDHRSFALTTEDLAGATFRQRLDQVSQQSLPRHTDERP